MYDRRAFVIPYQVHHNTGQIGVRWVLLAYCCSHLKEGDRGDDEIHHGLRPRNGERATAVAVVVARTAGNGQRAPYPVHTAVDNMSSM